MAFLMDFDACSSPFEKDEDDNHSCSMSISSDEEECCSRTVVEDHTKPPIQPSTEAHAQYSLNGHHSCSFFSPTADLAGNNSLNATLYPENTSSIDKSEFRSYNTTEHYQTRWTYTCNHMLIHDDEDPLYPIRFGPRQLHKTFSELCPMCKELAASVENNNNKKRKKRKILKDNDPPPIHGTSKADILAESTTRADALRLAVLAAQRDEVLKYAQFLDADTEGSKKAWGWYDRCNKEWAAKVWEVEKRSAGIYTSSIPSIPFPYGTLEENFTFVRDKAYLLLQASSTLLESEDIEAANVSEGALDPGMNGEIFTRHRFFRDLWRELEDMSTGGVAGCSGMQVEGLMEKNLMDVWRRFVRFMDEG
ncbi:hypothetical protein ONS95_009187 [Cadophora gregata]|uniref:uncharacterized protein n=1 Tax=Cadophora gregata TaxID=51156 RepID=UPI0026DDACE9|nr:uncharacterized protein ONS95_009187 [Cadophora gregata]KAK0124207.1 hypothetical protein ONS95_009187 [Cadophora gregata]KAK0129938.1 hypothetical protein ONS96_000480 [Cadophora gregata f. sp. sojae]